MVGIFLHLEGSLGAVEVEDTADARTEMIALSLRGLKGHGRSCSRDNYYPSFFLV